MNKQIFVNFLFAHQSNLSASKFSNLNKILSNCLSLFNLHKTNEIRFNNFFIENKCFSSFTETNTSSSDKEHSSNDGNKSLEGRYATAIFNVAISQGKLENVYTDLQNFNNSLISSPKISSFLLSRHITITEGIKAELLNTLENSIQFSKLSSNFLSLLISSKRLYLFNDIFKVLQKLYRTHNGLKYCQVTTSNDLSISDRSKVVNAIQKRVGSKYKLLVDFMANPSIMGGIMISLDDQVLDFTISSRIERLQYELLEPILLS